MSVVAVVWSEEARQTYFDIINFLVERWTHKEVQRFLNRTETIVDKIAQDPYLFAQYKSDPLIRKVVLHATVIVIYKISQDGTVINLLTFWATRNDPNKLNLL